MLVGAFQIDVGGPFHVRPVFQRESVGGAGIEPHIENVHDLLPRLTGALAEEALARPFGKPSIRALGLEGVENALVDGLVLKHIAVFIGKNTDRHAPGALAREHPVGPVGDHCAQTRLPRRWHEAGLVDGLERAGAQC